MKGWLESVVGPGYANALMWAIVALIALLVLLILVRIVRGFGVGTFVAGGRNRKARLAVMDATAVDSHRRLVLVRRDDVEHLILIGGPTDVVVEQNIRLIAPTRRTVIEDEQPRAQAQPIQKAQRPAPRQAPAPAPAPLAPAAAMSTPPSTVRTDPRPAQTAPLHAPASPPVAPESQPARRVEMPVIPVAPIAPVTHAAPLQPDTVAGPSPRSELEDTLLQELELSLDSRPTAEPVTVRSEPEKTLDDEMSKLLNDLAGQR